MHFQELVQEYVPASQRELPKKEFQAKLHSFLIDIQKQHDD